MKSLPACHIFSPPGVAAIASISQPSLRAVSIAGSVNKAVLVACHHDSRRKEGTGGEGERETKQPTNQPSSHLESAALFIKRNDLSPCLSSLPLSPPPPFPLAFSGNECMLPGTQNKKNTHNNVPNQKEGFFCVARRHESDQRSPAAMSGAIRTNVLSN